MLDSFSAREKLHEITNKLTVISVFASQVGKADLDEKMKNKIARLIEVADETAALVKAVHNQIREDSLTKSNS